MKFYQKDVALSKKCSNLQNQNLFNLDVRKIFVLKNQNKWWLDDPNMPNLLKT
jgi:hypothetical protein